MHLAVISIECYTTTKIQHGYLANEGLVFDCVHGDRGCHIEGGVSWRKLKNATAAFAAGLPGIYAIFIRIIGKRAVRSWPVGSDGAILAPFVLDIVRAF